MTYRHDWSKAVSWEGDDPPNGFERTLPPSDPRARSGAPAAGYAVRDNRKQVIVRQQNSSVVEAQTPPAPSVGDMPLSGVRQLGSTDRLRAGIPVARITRDLDEAPFEMDTWFDPRRQPDTVLELTPDFASEYVPPQRLPEVAQHKTFELRPVRLAPEIHPRTAPTILNARAVKRRNDKQQKDAREIAALLEQADRRRRGPWIAVAFLVVVAIGFVIGVELVDSSAAGAEAGTVAVSPALAVPASPTPVHRALPTQSDAVPAPHAPATGPVTAADAGQLGTKRAANDHAQRTSGEPVQKPPPARARHAAKTETPQGPAPAPLREVWLK